MGNPVGEEDDKEAGEGAGNHFFTFFLRLFVGRAGEHSEATHDQHAKEDETSDRQEGGEEAVYDTTNGVVATV